MRDNGELPLRNDEICIKNGKYGGSLREKRRKSGRRRKKRRKKRLKSRCAWRKMTRFHVENDEICAINDFVSLVWEAYLDSWGGANCISIYYIYIYIPIGFEFLLKMQRSWRIPLEK